MRNIFLVPILITLCLISAAAQVADQDDNQSWNDVQITVPVNEQFDFTLVGTFRFGKNITQLNDRRAAVGVVYKPNKSWSFQPFYWNIVARNSRGRFLMEHRLNFRATYRFPFKKFGLSHRSWVERRLRKPRNSWRYRPSLSFEKGIEKIIPDARVFVTEEVFYDSILKKFSRNRFSVGVNKTLTKKLSLDVFYMRQNDGFSRPGDLNVVGTSWRIKF
ncbi:MAG TPA: DUF2490 domain-containing protein [Pyrinomonadaceae bacterium]|nr:DUF2490 domain-containing protein [Pyrinomonadaceae bacterium]